MPARVYVLDVSSGVIYKLICQMGAPKYPRNGNQRSWPNHCKQTNGSDDLHFWSAPIR